MVIVWKSRRNIIRTALCWILWHNVHSQQHTYVSSSYRSNRLGLSHWDPYAVRRGGCRELYYCNMVEWFWWDSNRSRRPTGFLQCSDTVGLVIWPVKIVPEITYNVLSGTLNSTLLLLRPTPFSGYQLLQTSSLQVYNTEWAKLSSMQTGFPTTMFYVSYHPYVCQLSCKPL